MATHPSSFKQALSHQNKPLANLCAKIEQQQKLLAAIKKKLPASLAEHARHCVSTEKKLLLYTDSSAWASQLRFYTQAILSAIEPITRHRIGILQIRIVEAVAPERKPNKRTAVIPTHKNISMIRSNLAEPDDPLDRALNKLRATLERLSESNPDSKD